MLKGVVYMLIATIAFAWMNFLAKYLQDFHPLQVVFFRATGTFVFIFPYMLFKKVPIIGKHVFWLSFRGVISFASIALFFVVIQRIPLGSAVALRYIAPVFGVLLAFYFLKEKVKLWQWISLGITIVGAFIIKGVDFRIDSHSFFLVMLSALLLGGVFTIVRYLGPREHYLTIINYFMVFSIIGSLFYISQWRMPNPDEWIWVALIGVVGLIGQIYMTRAFQVADTSVVAPLKYLELVYALLLGFLFFDETYSMWPIIGMLLVVGGLVLNIWINKKAKF